MIAGMFFTPIQEKQEFKKFGETFRLIEFNKGTGLYLFERTYEDEEGKTHPSWEVVKPIKKKQPDGTPVEIYPSDENFGVYGKCFGSEEWARLCLKLGFEKWAEWKDEWRKSKTV